MKRLLLLLLLAVVTAAGLIWWNRAAFVEQARRELERSLTRALSAPTTVRALRVSLVPPLVRAEGILIGEEGAFARLDRLDLRIALLSTVAEARLVAKMAAKSLYVDLTRLPEPQEPVPIVIPAFRIGGVRIDDLRLRFRMGDEIGFLSVAQMRGQLDSSILRSLLTADLAFKQCVLQRASRSMDLGDIRITGYRDSQGVTIESASLAGPGRKIEMSGSTPTRHELKGELDLHDLVIIDDDFDPFSGSGRVSGEVVGTLDAPTLQGLIEIDDVHIAGRRVGVLTSNVHHHGETTRFENARLHGDDGEVRGNVTARFRREIPVEGTLTWDVAALETLLNKVDVALGFDNRLRATTIIKGQFDPLDLQVTAEGTVLAKTDAAQVRASSTIGRHGANTEFLLTQGSRTVITGALKVHDGKLEGNADVESTDLKGLAAIAPRAVGVLDLSGTGRGTILIRGTSAAPRIEGTIIGGPLSVTAVAVDEVSGAFAWTERALEIPSATVSTQGGEAALSGTIALEPGVANAWRLNLNEFDIDLATRIARGFGGFPEVVQGGTLTGLVECTGVWADPELRASLVGAALRVAGEDFDRVKLDGQRLPSQWHLDIDATHASDVRVNVTGGARRNAPARLSVTATPLDLRQLEQAKRFGITGTVALDGELTGDPATPGGRLRLSATDVAIGEEEIGGVELRATGAKGSWTIEGEAPAKRLSISATVAAKSPFAYRTRLDWQDFAFDYRATETEHLAGATTGVASFEGELAAIEASVAALQVADLHLQWGEAVIGLETPIVGSGRLSGMQIQPFSLVGKETRLTISGSVTSAAELSMALDGAISLDYLELLGEPFVSTTGKINLDMNVRRSAARGWEADGTALLERCVLDFGLPAALSNATGKIVFHGRGADIEHFTAKSGGGQVSLAGKLDLNAGPGLAWHVSDVALNLDEDLEGVISGDGTLDGAWRELLLKGAIEVKSALYSRDFEVVDIPALFKPTIALVAETQPPVLLHLDLKTTGREGLYVDNNIAQVEVSLDGRIKGTPQEPQFVGTLDIITGKVKVRRRTFTLNSGAADFRGEFPPNPNVNINAETEISTREADYLVTATVTGTARDPIVHFSSDDPSLTQNDLITLVAVGRTAAELQSESGGVTSIDALALLPTAPVEEQVSQLVGIDRFEIDLAQTNSQGDVSPGVTIGKNLTDRFRAALTTTFDTDARNAVVLEYDLTRRVSVIGQWEADTESEAGAFGGGVRLRYEFRRLPFSILGRRAQRSEPDAN